MQNFFKCNIGYLDFKFRLTFGFILFSFVIFSFTANTISINTIILAPHET